jgi:hypothetical protein
VYSVESSIIAMLLLVGAVVMAIIVGSPDVGFVDL